MPEHDQEDLEQLEDDEDRELAYLGSCERCGGDVLEGGGEVRGGLLYCDGCAWYVDQASKRPRRRCPVPTPAETGCMCPECRRRRGELLEYLPGGEGS